MNKKIAFTSLGCDKNRVDSEVMLGILQKNGYTAVADEAEADIIVVNTCCFIKDALEESIETILEMAQYKDPEVGNCKGLIVAGCLGQRFEAEFFDELPEVDGLVVKVVRDKCPLPHFAPVSLRPVDAAVLFLRLLEDDDPCVFFGSDCFLPLRFHLHTRPELSQDAHLLVDRLDDTDMLLKDDRLFPVLYDQLPAAVRAGGFVVVFDLSRSFEGLTARGAGICSIRSERVVLLAAELLVDPFQESVRDLRHALHHAPHAVASPVLCIDPFLPSVGALPVPSFRICCSD